MSILIRGASAAECGVAPARLWSLAAPRAQAGAPVPPAGLRLTFVGPEVPASLHGCEVVEAAVPEALGRGARGVLCLRHYRGPLTDFFEELQRQSEPVALKRARVTDGSGSGGGGDDIRIGSTGTTPEGDGQELGADPVDAPHFDAIVAFNPGFTCPDYEWDLCGLAARAPDVPFVLVTNTAAERGMDRAALAAEHGVGLAKVTEAAGPFGWLAWRQSGTLGNDVYRKNSHVVSGRIRAAGDRRGNDGGGGGSDGWGNGGEEGSSYAALALEARSHKKKGKRKGRR